MITVRKSEDRGHFDHGWLDTRHTFSFADYHDPRQMGFRALRVINEDRVLGGEGFGTHGHRDMEIVSYVLEGALEHRDSIGTGSVLTPGEVQRMSAGTGVRHSEFNGSKSETAHFLQIWLLPAKAGIRPSYEQKPFGDEERRNRLRLIVGPGAPDGALDIHQDARIYATLLDAGSTVEQAIAPGRHAWVQVARGAVTVNSTPLAAGDGAAISDESKLAITATAPSELLVFDLA